MNKTKSKKNKAQKETEEIDPDHFTVFKLKTGWEKEMADVWSPDTIREFKERQELLRTIPLEMRVRTKLDKSYRKGWVDAANWIHQEMQKVFHSDNDIISTAVEPIIKIINS